ncbi:ELWxxDGT repeat protein [Spirosoma koreense]
MSKTGFIVALFITLNAQAQTPVQLTTGLNDVSNITNVNGIGYFKGLDAAHGSELWVSNGTPDGTYIQDIRPGTASSDPQWLTKASLISTLFFTANDGSHGVELWASTPAVTYMVKDINPGAGSSTPNSLAYVNGVLYFAASDGEHGSELWRSDGTTNGTYMIMDIFPGYRPSSNVKNTSSPYGFAALDGTLDPAMVGIVLFAATDAEHGNELWRTDGTENGTFLVKDIRPGVTGSGPQSSLNGQPLCSAGGAVYFTAYDGEHGNELFHSDGTAGGTYMVRDIYPINNVHIGYLTNVNGTVFFSANDNVHGQELWKTDGTGIGTQMVMDIRPGSASSSPFGITELNRFACFVANDGVHGNEIWRSNGYDTGTALIKDLDSDGSGFYAGFGKVNGVLYFTGWTGSKGFELWKTDGTTNGTVLVADVDPAGNSTPVKFTSGTSSLYFAANPNSASYPQLYIAAPDISPTLYARPSTVRGNGTLGVVTVLSELNSMATTGTLTVKVTKDPRVTLGFNPNLTSVNGQPVNNSLWNFDATSSRNYYTLTTTRSVAAGDIVSFGLTGVLNPGATVGVLTISSVIMGNNEIEAQFDNNVSSNRIDYFPQ